MDRDLGHRADEGRARLHLFVGEVIAVVRHQYQIATGDRNNIVIYKAPGQGAWTASGGKAVAFSLRYPVV